MKKLALLLLVALYGCKNTSDNTLFKLIDSDHSNITFTNTIVENDTLNILEMEYIYNGGGVAIGDFNSDGLSDIFFTGNIVANQLYLNRGDMVFEDISEYAGVTDTRKWRSGVAVADVNNDGKLDIYLCATIKKDSALRANILYINQGNDALGRPSFKDEAAAYGIADTGHSTNAAFLDYDNDGDLDLYVLINFIEKGTPTNYKPKVNDGTAQNTDKLYRNDGNGTFTNVSKEAGILHEGFGLGLSIADINGDGWEDIYVSNDYITNDVLYINNKNGTFTNAIAEYIRHQSQFSMGNDIADINNDGLPDIITLDMLPEGNLRRKTVIGGPGYTTYINNEKYGYEYQYVRNMVQLNNGDGTFSEIGQMAGLHQTEWSWSPLFADFDNDGNRDALITNGYPRDVTDRDFANFRGGPGGNIASIEFLLDSIPVVKVSNYAYRNNGDLTFKDVSKDWGFTTPSFSNGAAFADLDNDGDLDYIVNNINDKAFLYENTLYTSSHKEGKSTHFLRVKLAGKEDNTQGIGAKVSLHYAGGKSQFHHQSLGRGYISSVEGTIHFGLGKTDVVDTLVVTWPDGKTQMIQNVKADQVLTVDYKNAGDSKSPDAGKGYTPLVREVTASVNVKFKHSEDDFIDFNSQRTLPRKFSQSGPAIATGDVNGDGLEDFILGGAKNNDEILFLQNSNGTFKQGSISKTAKESEDEGLLLFDADNDGDLDLYAVSGGFEFPADHASYADRLYINYGKGKFTVNDAALPKSGASGSCARAADFDGDGDLDLFVGGRVSPTRYPMPAESYILRNNGGKFTDVTDEVASGLKLAGMVTDALWTDFNNDGKVDLLIAYDFMPIVAYSSDGKKLTRVNDSGLDKFSGWWNSLTAGDFDKDGDTDYIAGNLGRNNYYRASDEYPLRICAKDFDGNNSIDAIISCYFKSETGELKEYPAHFWEELNSQSPKFRRKFSSYKKFGSTTMEGLLSKEELEGALHLTANYMASSYIENKGSGKFTVTPLPVLAQVAPVNGMATGDFNNDGNLDVIMVGNDYGNEVFSGRYDAFTGLILAGNGKGAFSPISSASSGFEVNRDAKALSKISGVKEDLYIATQNRDSVKIFLATTPVARKVITPQSLDTWAEVTYADGRKERVEFYYGSGFQSQSTRKINVPAGVKSVEIFDSRGKSRKIEPAL